MKSTINEEILLPFLVGTASAVITGSVVGGIAIGMATGMIVVGGKQYG